MFRIKSIIAVILSFLLVMSIAACNNSSGGNSAQAGYDGRTYDISAAEDSSLTLTVSKVGNNYELIVSGAGKAVDYNGKDKVPWNVVLKKVTSVTVDRGVESLGDYYFFSANLESVILPSTVKEIGANCFNPETVIYSYSSTEITTENTIYYYSETAPDEEGKYFHVEDGTPILWKTYSVLFVGNSFTYRPNFDNPTVPYLFGEIATKLGQTVNVDSVVKGSHSLTRFSSDTDEMGAIVKQKLEENQYDFIVLQEQSTTPLNNYNNFETAVKNLVAKIAKTQTAAKVYLYQTWGSPTAIEGTSYKSVTEMSLALSAAYKRCADETDLPVTYVGNAFAVAYDENKINVYDTDDRHQNMTGAYLSACCHVVSMLKLDVRKCSFYGELAATTAKTMQNIAYQANA